MRIEDSIRNFLGIGDITKIKDLEEELEKVY